MTADALLAVTLEAQARNREQRTLGAQACAHVRELARTATLEQRGLLHNILLITKQLAESNAAEYEHERMIAGALDRLDANAKPWSFRRVVRELRDPLAVLVHPFTGEASKAEARDLVRAVLRSCPRELLVTGDNVSPKLVHAIGARKAGALWSLLLDATTPMNEAA